MKGTQDKKETLKKLIKRLHEGASLDEARKQFKETMADITPTEIAQIEEELVRDGMPLDEVHRLCDVHLALFQESLEKKTPLAPAGHPIHILMEEHKAILKFANELVESARKLAGSIETIEQVGSAAKHFKESESHYLREENVLFPYLEKHGITQPPAIMWTEHDRIRTMEKDLFGLVDVIKDRASEETAIRLRGVASSLADMLSGHFYKENNVLFPTSLKVIEEDEWLDIRGQFDKLGYCPFTPTTATTTFGKTGAAPPVTVSEEMIAFETGSLSREEVEAILDALPVEVTFVDRDDRLRYFSQSKEMIFVRTKAAIGLKVQRCHPQKSIHVVNKILEDFKSGRRNEATFWINFKGKLVYIRYYPVRNKKGEYLGCVEVTQDVTDMKKLEGERRLLDTA
jgi:hypothetical protein